MFQHGSIEDQYLDFLISLAFEKQECDEIAAVSNSPVEPEGLANEHTANMALHAAYERIGKETHHKRRTKLLSIAGRFSANVIKIAACIALVIVIAGPVAFAQSPTFRSKVMELLMQFDTEQGTVTYSFEEVPSAAFDVPAGWTGTHFMAYVPEEFEIYEFDPDYQEIEYRNTSNCMLFFGEYDESTVTVMGTDDADVSYISIHGQPASVVEAVSVYDELPIVSIAWSNNVNWFNLYTFGLGKEETLRIAEAIKIIKK